ncbi:8793_t:CDS:2, partial [Cetraspora pellucida]
KSTCQIVNASNRERRHYYTSTIFGGDCEIEHTQLPQALEMMWEMLEDFTNYTRKTKIPPIIYLLKTDVKLNFQMGDTDRMNTLLKGENIRSYPESTKDGFKVLEWYLNSVENKNPKFSDNLESC